MKKIRYTLVLVLSLGLFFSYSITSENSASAANKISIVNYDNDKKIEKEATKQLYVGESADYDVKFNDKYYDGKKGSISEIKTSNTKILNYKPNTTGEFNALSVGTAVLSVTMSNVKTSLTVTVRQPVTSLMPKYQDITLTKGQSTQLDTEILPSNATYKSQGLSYTSQNSNVVSVNQNGQVVANNQGHTKINISFENKNRYGSKTPKFVQTDVTISVVEQSSSSPSASQSINYSLILKSSVYQVMNKGETKSIAYLIQPNIDPKPEVRFESKNTKIATVNNNGVVKAVNKGVTKISIIMNNVTTYLTIKVQDIYSGGTKNSKITKKIDKYQFSFLNTLSHIQKSKIGYKLSKTDKEKMRNLLRKAGYTNYYIEKLFYDYVNATWEGVCFGMSAVYTLNFQKLLNFRKVAKQNPPKKKEKWYLNKVQKPIVNSKVRSLINYYHISQDLFKESLHLIYQKSDWREANKVVSNNSKKKVQALFGFTIPKRGAHMTILQNKKACPPFVDSRKICINLIDPNKEFDYLRISPDFRTLEIVYTSGLYFSISEYQYTTNIINLFKVLK